MKKQIPGWRVLGWNRSTSMWTIRSWHPTAAAASRATNALRKRGFLARMVPATRLLDVPQPPTPSPARTFRHEQAAAMLERSDALKRYKSMG